MMNEGTDGFCILNSTVSSLKKPDLAPSPIPKKEFPPPNKNRMELRWGEGRRSDFGRSEAELLALPHYRSVVISLEKSRTRSVRRSQSFAKIGSSKFK